MIPKIQSYDKFLGNYLVLEDTKQYYTGFFIPKGAEIKLKKINKYNEASFKIVSSPESYEEGIKSMVDKLTKQNLKEYNQLMRVVKLWDNEPEKFIKDPKSFWNKSNSVGHCINTQFPIPIEHPDKECKFPEYALKSDTINTFDYIRTDGKTNDYSYHLGRNMYYSRDTYYFMAQGKLLANKELEDRDNERTKSFINFATKHELSLTAFNKFKLKKIK